MHTQIQKWGNSLALRIPKAFASEAQVDEGTLVNLSLVKGSLVATPLRTSAFTLKELLAQVTDQNIHTELEFGAPTGREIW